MPQLDAGKNGGGEIGCETSLYMENLNLQKGDGKGG